MDDLISRQAAIDAFEAYKNCIKAVLGDENELIKIVITCRNIIDELPSAQPERSLWFRIGEICVDESKGFISAERAVEKIRELLREGR